MNRAPAASGILTRRNYPIALYLLAAFSSTIATLAAPPADFPTFQVPGYEHEMTTLRALFWRHYPGSGPKATLWDEWLSQCSLWPATTNDPSCDSMRGNWKKTLSSRIIDTDGYVATHQHASIAHQLGWPFPF